MDPHGRGDLDHFSVSRHACSRLVQSAGVDVNCKNSRPTKCLDKKLPLRSNESKGSVRQASAKRTLRKTPFKTTYLTRRDPVSKCSARFRFAPGEDCIPHEMPNKNLNGSANWRHYR